MRTVVPFAARDPKTRLTEFLSESERAAFSRVMLDDVLDAVSGAGGDPELLATAPVDVAVPVTVDERPLTEAVNAVLDAADGPVAIVMADLALATPDAIRRLYDAGRDADVAVSPGRGGGTNALVVSHPDFRVDYHGCSYCDHRDAARDVGASVAVVDSFRLSTDVDEPTDIAEVLLHGEGACPEWLREAGVELAVEGGRVTVRRN